jgi:hypothetical protein
MHEDNMQFASDALVQMSLLACLKQDWQGMRPPSNAAQKTAHSQRHCSTFPSPAAITSAFGCFSAAIAAVIASLLLPAPFSSTQQRVAASLW